jgi:hypothetical protein
MQVGFYLFNHLIKNKSFLQRIILPGFYRALTQAHDALLAGLIIAAALQNVLS